MSDTTNSWIKWIFGVIFVLLLIALVAGIMIMSTRKGNEATAQAEKDLETMSETRYTKYDGQKITGSQVLSAIQMLNNDKICVIVNVSPDTTANIAALTAAGAGTNYIYTDASLTTPQGTNEATLEHNAQNPADATYINPSSNFYGKVFRSDTTGVITTVYFQRVTD